MAHSLLCPSCNGWFAKCREPRFYFTRSAMTGSPPTYFRIETASPLKRRSQGLSCVIGNFHAQFLEGWTAASRLATRERKFSGTLLRFNHPSIAIPVQNLHRSVRRLQKTSRGPRRDVEPLLIVSPSAPIRSVPYTATSRGGPVEEDSDEYEGNFDEQRSWRE